MTDSPAFPDDITRLRKIAAQMDNAFRIPVFGVRIGWDSLLGLVPGVGDALALAPAAYIVKEAHRLGASPATLVRMGVNIGIDTAIGAIPLIGDIFDIGWKANTRNVDLLHRELSTAPAAGTKKAAPDGAAP